MNQTPAYSGRRAITPKATAHVNRRLLSSAGFVLFGLVFAILPLISAVSAFRNEHRFAHAPHVAAVVETAQQAKGLYVQIGLRYSLGGREYAANAQDPNAVDQTLTPGETVDALYLPDDPRKVAIAGEYGTGFQQRSAGFAAFGLVLAGIGVGTAVKAVRYRKREGLRWRDLMSAAHQELNAPDGTEPPRWC